MHTMKCHRTNEKFAFLLFISFLFFTSCKQSGSQNSESISDQVSNLISSNPCDKFIGKYTRSNTVSMYGATATTTLNVTIEKEDNYYIYRFNAKNKISNADSKTEAMINNMLNSSMPDYIKCECNDKNNLEISAGGKTSEISLDKNNDLYAGGYIIKRVEKFESESNISNTETVTEEATETDIEVGNYKDMNITGEDVEAQENINTPNIKLPFTGTKYFNFDSDYHTRYSISIEENGNCVVKRVGYYGESIETTYNGKYEKVINTDNAQNYSIRSNKIYFVDYSGNNLTDGNTGKAIYSELTTEKIGHK